MDTLEFSNTVAAYLNRSKSALIVNEVDLVLRAMNNAKSYAQRMLDFEMARVSVDVSVGLSSGGLLSTAKDHYNAEVEVKINRIERAYVTCADGVTIRPVDFVSQQGAYRRLKQAWDGLEHDFKVTPAKLGILAMSPVVVRQGDVIRLFPNNQQTYSADTVTVCLDVVKLLPDYDETITSDFLLDDCYEFMFYKTLSNMCLYTKDLELKKMMDYSADLAWKSVVSWNDSISNDIRGDDMATLD